MKRSVLSLILALVMIFNLGFTALAATDLGNPDVDTDTGSGDFNIDFDALNKTEGSETNPIKVEKQANMPAILVIPANGEMWYDITTDMNGKYITINGNANTVVALNGVEYLPNAQGIVQVKLDGETVNKLQVSNTGSSNVNWSTTVGNPAGSQESPTVISIASTLKTLSVAGHDTLYLKFNANLAGKELTIAAAEGVSVSCNGEALTADERGFVTILASGVNTVTVTNANDGWVTLAAGLNNPLGSQSNPIDLVWTWNAERTLGTASITIPAKTTQYVKISVSDYELYVDNAFNCVTTGTASKPQAVGIQNTSSAATTFNLKLGYPLGKVENPDELVLGSTTVDLPENFGGYHLNWTAAQTGYLTLTMHGEDWTYTINNLTTGKELAAGWSADGEEAAFCIVPVTAGEKIQLIVSTYDPWAWFPPAGVLTFETAFTTEFVCKHNNVTVIKGTAATCTASGMTDGQVCASCGETLVEQTVIPALGHNYVDGTCGNCGEADPNAIKKFDIDVARMVLGNALEFQFGVDMTKIPDTTGYYAVIEKTWADGANTTKTIPATEWGTVGPYWAIVYDGLAAKEMSDTFYVTVYNAKGQAVSNAKVDSVRDYVMRNVNSQTAILKTLMVNMLNYGADAQVNFEYGTNDLANKLLTDTQKAWATAEVAALNNNLVSGTNYMGTRLVLESRIQLQVAFKGMTRDMYAIYTFTDNDGKEQNVRVEGADFVDVGILGVEMSALVYADARSLVEITVYNADDTVYGTATDSIEGYAARNSSNVVVMALMKFADSAKAYLYPNAK